MLHDYFTVQMKASRIDYFPRMRALSLKDEADEDNKQLDELKSMVETMHNRFGSLEAFVKNFQTYVGHPACPQPSDN